MEATKPHGTSPDEFHFAYRSLSSAELEKFRPPEIDSAENRAYAGSILRE